MAHLYKVPFVLTARVEVGSTVSSPALPALITEGDTLEQALAHVQDVLAAVVELYEDLGRALPQVLT